MHNTHKKKSLINKDSKIGCAFSKNRTSLGESVNLHQPLGYTKLCCQYWELKIFIPNVHSKLVAVVSFPRFLPFKKIGCAGYTIQHTLLSVLESKIIYY